MNAAQPTSLVYPGGQLYVRCGWVPDYTESGLGLAGVVAGRLGGLGPVRGGAGVGGR